MKRIAVTTSFFALPAHADTERHGHMMDWGYGLMFGPILWLIVLGLIVAGVIWVLRNPEMGQGMQGRHRDDAGAHGDADALAMLKMRFAKGEIDEEEFTARKELLKG